MVLLLFLSPFADSNAGFSFEFVSLPDNSIPYEPISYADSQKVDIYKAFDEISMITNNLFFNIFTSTSKRSISYGIADDLGKIPSNKDIVISPRFLTPKLFSILDTSSLS